MRIGARYTNRLRWRSLQIAKTNELRSSRFCISSNGDAASQSKRQYRSEWTPYQKTKVRDSLSLPYLTIFSPSRGEIFGPKIEIIFFIGRCMLHPAWTRRSVSAFPKFSTINAICWVRLQLKRAQSRCFYWGVRLCFVFSLHVSDQCPFSNDVTCLTKLLPLTVHSTP